MEEAGVSSSCWGKLARPYLVFLSAINIYAWYVMRTEVLNILLN